MELNLDEKVIQATMQEATTSAIRKALENWSVEERIRNTVADAVVGEVLTDAVTAAVKKLDLSALSDALAREIEKATTAFVVKSIREALVEVVLRVRGVRDFEDEKREKMRAELLREIA